MIFLNILECSMLSFIWYFGTLTFEPNFSSFCKISLEGVKNFIELIEDDKILNDGINLTKIIPNKVIYGKIFLDSGIQAKK